METKKTQNLTVRNYVYTGAIQGFIAWTIYAIVECFFASIMPWIVQHNYDYKPVNFGFTVLLFTLYPVFGIVLGSIIGAGLHVISTRIQFLRQLQYDTYFIFSYNSFCYFYLGDKPVI